MLLFLKFYYQNQTRHLYNYFLDVPLILLEIIISISLIYSNYIYFYTTLQLSVAIYLLLKNKKREKFILIEDRRNKFQRYIQRYIF